MAMTAPTTGTPAGASDSRRRSNMTAARSPWLQVADESNEIENAIDAVRSLIDAVGLAIDQIFRDEDLKIYSGTAEVALARSLLKIADSHVYSAFEAASRLQVLAEAQ